MGCMIVFGIGFFFDIGTGLRGRGEFHFFSCRSAFQCVTSMTFQQSFIFRVHFMDIIGYDCIFMAIKGRQTCSFIQCINSFDHDCDSVVVCVIRTTAIISLRPEFFDNFICHSNIFADTIFGFCFCFPVNRAALSVSLLISFLYNS
eukprot:UN07603